MARYVLLGFTLCVQELDDGGRLFELRHANQVNDRNSISLHFRVAHSGNAERLFSSYCLVIHLNKEMNKNLYMSCF